MKPIEDRVLEALEEVRATGEVNMMDRRGVAAGAQRLGYGEEALWLLENRDSYLRVLRRVGERGD